MSAIEPSTKSTDTEQKMQIFRREDFAERTIHAPHSVAQELRNRLCRTYAQFSVITIDEDEIHVSADIYELAKPLVSDNFRVKPR